MLKKKPEKLEPQEIRHQKNLLLPSPAYNKKKIKSVNLVSMKSQTLSITKGLIEIEIKIDTRTHAHVSRGSEGGEEGADR